MESDPPKFQGHQFTSKRLLYCEVPNCSNTNRSRKPGLEFYSFPRGWRNAKWVEAIQKPAGWIACSIRRICSDHFQEKDFEPDKRGEYLGIEVRRRISKAAVPSLLLPPSKACPVPDTIAIDASSRPCEIEIKVENLVDNDIDKNDETAFLEPCLICSENGGNAADYSKVHKFPGACGSTSLNGQLWATFVLRKCLAIPMWKCEEILRKSGGSIQPSSWFVLCDKCADMVGQVAKMFEKIQALQTETERLAKSLQNQIHSSWGKGEKTQNRTNFVTDIFSVGNEIRCFLMTGLQTPDVPKVDDNYDGKPNLTLDSKFTNTEDSNSAKEDRVSVQLEAERTCSKTNDSDDSFRADDLSDQEYIPRSSRRRPKRLAVDSNSSKHFRDFRRDASKNSKSVSNNVAGRKPYQCSECNKKYRYLPHFKKHLKGHEYSRANRTFDCCKCDAPFITLSSLRFHLKIHHSLKLDKAWDGSTPQDAWVSPIQKPNEKDTRNLKVDSESSDRKEICPICHAKFKTNQGLRYHEKFHRPIGDNVNCPECDMTFTSNETLRRHLREKHKPSPPICELCGYKASGRDALKMHLIRHKIYDNSVTGEEPPVPATVCNMCKESFRSIKELVRHKINIHSGDLGINVYTCSECPTSYLKKSELESHILIKHKKQFKYTCEICGHGTQYKQSHMEHMSIKHSNEATQFMCELCSATYARPTNLKSHVKKYHPEHYAKSTPQLGRNNMSQDFQTTSQSLVTNQATTTENNNKTREFRCKYCTSTFPNKLALKYHFSDRHKEMYCHKCNICEKSYMSVASLQLHKKINHKEKQQKAMCAWCFKVVSHRLYLYNHVKFCRKKPTEVNAPRILAVEDQNNSTGNVNEGCTEN